MTLAPRACFLTPGLRARVTGSRAQRIPSMKETEMRSQPRPLPSWATPACRLWKRTDVAGVALVGNWRGLKVLIYENPDKRDADDADYVLCVAAPLRHTNSAGRKTTINSAENKS